MSTYGLGMRTVGGQTSSRTKYGRCCTKTHNLNKDFEEFLDLVQQAGYVGPTKSREYWLKEKNDE